MTTTYIPTTEVNNCGGRCPLLVQVEDGVPVKVTGNPKYPDLLPCIKGRSAIETFLSGKRLLYPMKRTGKRGEGLFEQISWEEALDLITEKWIHIRDTYGPASRFVHYAWGVSAAMSGLREARRLMALDGGFQDYYNSYSTACCAYTTPYLYGTDQSGSSYDTLLDSQLILLWAHNPLETRFDNLMYYLFQCKEKGIPIISIDPRKNATATALGAQWISLYPGTDAALMDALAYVLYTEDLYDHTFVEEKCQGFTRESMPKGADPEDSYFDYLMGTKDGIKKDPAWAQKITGVEAETILVLGRRLGNTKPAAILQGYGGQRHLNGEQFTRGGIMLACLTGNVGIHGGWASGAGYCSMIREPRLPEPENPVKGKIPVYEWTDHLKKGKMKMIVNLAGNALINQHGDINKTKELLMDESLCEFLLCSDIVMTPSAKFADILLPGISMFEGENLTSPWSQGDYLTYVNKIVEPLGACREEYDWLKEIAKRLGLYEAFTNGHSTRKDWLLDLYEQVRQDDPDLPAFEVLKAEGIVRKTDRKSRVAFADGRFPTASGKVEIYSPVLKAMGHEKIPAIPGYVPEEEGAGTSAEYPLQLVGFHPITRTHSVHDHNEALQRKHPQRLWMHPEDAKKRGLKEEDMVLIWNARGSSMIRLHVTDQIQKGVTALSAGAWYQPDENGCDRRGSINIFTTLTPSPLAHGNGQHSCLVEVKKAP